MRFPFYHLTDIKWLVNNQVMNAMGSAKIKAEHLEGNKDPVIEDLGFLQRIIDAGRL